MKTSFLSFLDSSLGQERPLFSDLTYTLNGVTIFIEVNRDNTYKSFSFKQDQKNPNSGLFSLLSVVLPGTSILDFSNFSWSFFDDYWEGDQDFKKAFPINDRPFTPFPFLSVSQGLNEYFDEPARDQLQNQDYKELVCKCFGVYQNEIEETWLNDSKTTAFDITDQLRAGACCGSCLPQINEILAQSWNRLGHIVIKDEGNLEELTKGKSPRYGNKTQVEFLFQIEEELENWFQEYSIGKKGFEISGLDFYNLKIKIHGEKLNPTEVLTFQNGLADHLFKKSQVKLNLEITTEGLSNLQ